MIKVSIVYVFNFKYTFMELFKVSLKSGNKKGSVTFSKHLCSIIRHRVYKKVIVLWIWFSSDFIKTMILKSSRPSLSDLKNYFCRLNAVDQPPPLSEGQDNKLIKFKQKILDLAPPWFLILKFGYLSFLYTLCSIGYNWCLKGCVG